MYAVLPACVMDAFMACKVGDKTTDLHFYLITDQPLVCQNSGETTGGQYNSGTDNALSNSTISLVVEPF